MTDKEHTQGRWCVLLGFSMYVCVYVQLMLFI